VLLMKIPKEHKTLKNGLRTFLTFLKKVKKSYEFSDFSKKDYIETSFPFLSLIFMLN